jgi:hypothetical protein
MDIYLLTNINIDSEVEKILKKYEYKSFEPYKNEEPIINQ